MHAEFWCNVFLNFFKALWFQFFVSKSYLYNNLFKIILGKSLLQIFKIISFRDILLQVLNV